MVGTVSVAAGSMSSSLVGEQELQEQQQPHQQQHSDLSKEVMTTKA